MGVDETRTSVNVDSEDFQKAVRKMADATTPVSNAHEHGKTTYIVYDLHQDKELDAHYGKDAAQKYLEYAGNLRDTMHTIEAAADIKFVPASDTATIAKLDDYKRVSIEISGKHDPEDTPGAVTTGNTSKPLIGRDTITLFVPSIEHLAEAHSSVSGRTEAPMRELMHYLGVNKPIEDIFPETSKTVEGMQIPNPTSTINPTTTSLFSTAYVGYDKNPELDLAALQLKYGEAKYIAGPAGNNLDSQGTPTMYVGFTGEHGLSENPPGTSNYSPPTKEQQAAIKEILAAYSAEHNINFVMVDVDAKNPDLSKVNLTVRMAEPTPGDNPHALREGAKLGDAGSNDIIINRNQTPEGFRYTFEHELLHTLLGPDHVDNKGQSQTVMNSTVGEKPINAGPGPAPYDRDMLDLRYGARDSEHPFPQAGLKVGVSGEHFQYANGEVIVTDKNASITVENQQSIQVGDENFYTPDKPALLPLEVRGDGTHVEINKGSNPKVSVTHADNVTISGDSNFERITVENSQNLHIVEEKFPTHGAEITLGSNSSITLENPNAGRTTIEVAPDAAIVRIGNQYIITDSKGVSTIDVQGDGEMLHFEDKTKIDPATGNLREVPVLDMTQTQSTWGTGDDGPALETGSLKATAVPAIGQASAAGRGK